VQECLKAPFLDFLIFIIDIMELPNCYLYADDCLVVCSGEDPVSSTKNLEKDLTLYSNWYSQNLLALNASKTEIMTFSNSKFKPSVLPEVNFMGHKLPHRNFIKYLGFNLDCNLNMKTHLSMTKKKLFPLLSNFMRQRKYLNSSIAALWYKSLIRPNLEYCGSVTFMAGINIKKSLLSIENRCLKIMNPLKSKLLTRLEFSIPCLTNRLKYMYLLSFYKLIHKLVPITDNILLPTKPISGVTRLGETGGLLQGGPAGTHTLLNFGVSLYNGLPIEIRIAPDYKSFKDTLRRAVLLLDNDHNTC
jgi:hypothetical protein